MKRTHEVFPTFYRNVYGFIIDVGAAV
jgi:hypothetical protein